MRPNKFIPNGIHLSLGENFFEKKLFPAFLKGMTLASPPPLLNATSPLGKKQEDLPQTASEIFKKHLQI